MTEKEALEEKLEKAENDLDFERGKISSLESANADLASKGDDASRSTKIASRFRRNQMLDALGDKGSWSDRPEDANEDDILGRLLKILRSLEVERDHHTTKAPCLATARCHKLDTVRGFGRRSR